MVVNDHVIHETLDVFLKEEWMKESNVIYGMYSGLALLMDIHYPSTPNGYGVVFIAGSGWHAPLSLDAPPLKESGQTRMYGDPLTEAGYTVFSLNHRATPRFPYPAAVEDAQRAVRFIRYHADTYGIHPDRIGAVGGSSGGHLVSMLGVLASQGAPDADGPINQEDATVQCVVARAAPVDFLSLGAEPIIPFLAVSASRNDDPNSIEYKRVVEASPITYVSSKAPPFLLMHGDADPMVPFHQSELMQAALQKAGVEVELLRIPGGGHGPAFNGAENPPDYIGVMIHWLDRHLRGNHVSGEHATRKP
jgi:acetyl esterase/lipase